MRAKILAVAIMMLGLTILGGSASANSVILGFPSSGTDYYSATNGSGTIPAGGQSAPMWTTGDFVTQNFTGVDLDSVDSINFDFDYSNYLASGNNLAVDFYISGNWVGEYGIGPTTNGEIDGATGTMNFTPLVVNGTFTLSMFLNNTIPPGGGSIAFLDGGQFILSGTPMVPEPASLLLLGTGLAGIGLGAWRKKK